MKDINYNDFDTLHVYVKRQKFDEIVQYYSYFGWKLEDKSDNTRYEDLIDVTFIRPHKIKNKDELQLLQVYLDERLNSIGKIERFRYSRTKSLGISFAVFGVLFIVLGVLNMLNVLTFLGFATGMIFSIVGTLIILGLVFLPKIFKTEKTNYEKKQSILEKEIEDILKQVRGKNYEN